MNKKTLPLTKKELTIAGLTTTPESQKIIFQL